jgi:hypothetical protein
MRFGPDARRCRTEPPPFLTLRVGVDASVAIWDRDVPVDGAAAGLGIPVDVRIVGPLWAGGRMGYLVGGDAGHDADGDGFDDDNQENPKILTFAGGPRIVVDTEPSRQEAWRFGVSAGWLVPLNGGSAGPLLEAAVERQWGMLLVDPSEGEPTHGRGQDFSLGVRAQLGLEDAKEYRALSFTATYATELFAQLPGGVEPARSRPDVDHTVSADFFVGTGFRRGGLAQGMGLSLGLPFGRLVELRARGEAMLLAGTELFEGVSVYSALGGLRLSRWYLPWVEVLAGWGQVFGTRPHPIASSPVIEGAIGGQFPNALGCGYGLNVAQRVRFGLHDGDRRFVAITLGLGITYDSAIRASECWP